jgi:hypothetical protein
MFYAALLKSGRKKRPGEKGPAKGLAPKTVHNIHVMLNKALSDAARKGTVVRNVVALADAPSLAGPQAARDQGVGDRPARRGSSTRSRRTGWPRRSSSRRTPGCAAGRCSACGGVTSTSTPDRVSVRQALVSVAYEVSISDVKTGTSRRTIDIDEDVVQVLRGLAQGPHRGT